MSWSAWVASASMVVAVIFVIRYVGVNLSLSSVLLGGLILLHGPMYLYYTRVWGPETDFFDQIIAASGGRPVLEPLDIALALCLACVCLGIWIADRLYGVSGRRVRLSIDLWGLKPLQVPANEEERLRATIIVCCVLLLPFVVIDGQLLKIVEYLTTDPSEIERIAVRRSEGGSAFYLYNLLLSTAISFVLFAAIAARKLVQRWVRALTCVLLGLVLLGKLATLSKAPAVILLLQMGVVMALTRSLRVRTRTFIALVSAAMLGFVAMTFVAIPSVDGVSVALEFLFYRVFMIVNEGLVEYFAAIPYVLDFSWGAQVSWIGSIFQADPLPPTYLLVGEVHRNVFGSTTTVMFLGDAWADFAWAGVAAVSIAAGMIVRILDVNLIVKRGRSVGAIAGLALGQFGVFTALNTSLQTAMVTGGLVLVIPLVRLVSGPRDGAMALARALGSTRAGNAVR